MAVLEEAAPMIASSTPAVSVTNPCGEKAWLDDYASGLPGFGRVIRRCTSRPPRQGAVERQPANSADQAELRALAEQRADVGLLSAHLVHGEHPGGLVNGEHHASGYMRCRRPRRDVSGEQDGHAVPGRLESDRVVAVVREPDDRALGLKGDGLAGGLVRERQRRPGPRLQEAGQFAVLVKDDVLLSFAAVSRDAQVEVRACDAGRETSSMTGPGVGGAAAAGRVSVPTVTTPIAKRETAVLNLPAICCSSRTRPSGHRRW